MNDKQQTTVELIGGRLYNILDKIQSERRRRMNKDGCEKSADKSRSFIGEFHRKRLSNEGEVIACHVCLEEEIYARSCQMQTFILGSFIFSCMLKTTNNQKSILITLLSSINSQQP